MGLIEEVYSLVLPHDINLGDKSFMKILQRNGPKIDPCGTFNVSEGNELKANGTI